MTKIRIVFRNTFFQYSIFKFLKKILLSTNTCRSKRSKRCVHVPSEKKKKVLKIMSLFFKTKCFISDLYLHIFWNLGWIWWWCWWNFDFKFLYIFFYLLSASIKRPEITKPNICIRSEIQGICRFIILV